MEDVKNGTKQNEEQERNHEDGETKVSSHTMIYKSFTRSRAITTTKKRLIKSIGIRERKGK